MIALSGCLLINKRVGNTSRKEVNDVSHILHEKKVGHIGTLDPFASGLLIVLVGKATKISPFLERADKTYIATLSLGSKTDSGDLTGNVIETKDIPSLTKEDIEKTLNSFLGEQDQIPPMYSALKKDGKHLYDYARKGETIQREPRKINIFDIRLIDFKDNLVIFEAHVSKGTYIRTLGEDIAERLGTVGHLIALERTSVGEFNLKDAIAVDEVTPEKLKTIDEMLASLPSITLEGKMAFKALNGVGLELDSKDEEIIIKDKDGIIAIYKRDEKGIYFCLRGLRWKKSV